MIITVVEESECPPASKTLNDAFKRQYACGMQGTYIRKIKSAAFVGKILICMYLIFLICAVIICHTQFNGYDRAVGFVLTDHIYVFVIFCTHNTPNNHVRLYDHYRTHVRYGQQGIYYGKILYHMERIINEH